MSARILVDSLGSPVHYPLHTVSANEEPAGTEAWRFFTLRRSDHWSPATFNADAWLTIICNRPRAFDCVVLWDHNLAGEAFRLLAADDGFASPANTQTILDLTVPSVSSTGSVDDALGVLTEDGKWVKCFPPRIATAQRLFIPAMGANQKPSINGLLGLSYRFTRRRGDLVDANDLQAEELRSESGAIGRGTQALLRGGSIPIRLPTLFDYEQFRYHLQRYAGVAGLPGSPALLVFDEDRAEQAVMAIRPVGRLGFGQEPDWFYPSGQLPFVEWEP